MAPKNDIFYPIVKELSQNEVGLFGPESFSEYITRHELPKVGPVRFISVDSLEALSNTLKMNDCMVLRLGRGTFAVIKVNENLRDFFLIDRDIFSDTAEKFYPTVEPNQLLAYKLLPRLTENTLVNLGFSSGLISYSLNLDFVRPIYPPATCSSTFSFEFYPHTMVKSKLNYSNGQVEIDAMFVEKRKGKNTLFVIETKNEGQHRSLSKHKLFYPILGIANSVPKDIAIVPVYLKTTNKADGVHFHVVECNLPDPRERLVAIDELTVKSYQHIVLPKEILEV